MRTIGIYGGTFAPVHNGHINIAKAFYEQCGLEALFVIPASIPPHKRIDASDSPEHRLAMVRLAFEGEKGINVSDFEVKRHEKSYTVNTLEYFTECNPDTDIIFLCGADMYLTLDTWFHAERIYELARIAFIRRPGSDIESKRHESDIEIFFPPTDISSTKIRNMISRNEDVSEYMPKKVIDYIHMNNLYGSIPTI